MEKKKHLLLGYDRLKKLDASYPNVPQNITLGSAGSVAVSAGSALSISNAGNHYFLMDIYGDATTYPNNSTPLTNTDLYRRNPWWDPATTDAIWAETQSEFLVSRAANQNRMLTNSYAAGQWTGFCYVGGGLYNAQAANDGYLTNTVDFPTVFDACRGYCWFYWTNTNASDSLNFSLGARTSAGGTDWGLLFLQISRDYNNTPSIYSADGEGNTNISYMGVQTNVASDSTAIQWEFVPGSHCKLEMYQNVNGSLNFSSFTAPPNWLFDDANTCITRDLTGGNYADIEVYSPCINQGSSAEASCASIGKYATEYRATGGNWVYLT